MSDEFITLETDDGLYRYPTSEPYESLDQAAHEPDRLVLSVIAAIGDVLVDRAEALPPDNLDKNYFARIAGLARDYYEEAHDCIQQIEAKTAAGESADDERENLECILADASTLAGIQVDWEGFLGTVLVTLEDRWQFEQYPDDSCGELYKACFGEPQ